jgi:hypothetical protein
LAALKACDRPGVVKRAGFAGVIIGLDMNEAFFTAKALGAQDEFALVEYLMAIEVAAVVKSLERSKPLGNS